MVRARLILVATLLAPVGCSDSDAPPSPPTPSTPTDPEPFTPTARIEASGELAVGEAVLLDGQASRPTNGRFTWTLLERPEGNHRLEGTDRNVAVLWPVQPGRFVVQLAVEFSGRTDATTVELDIGCPAAEAAVSPAPGVDLFLGDWAPAGCVDYAAPETVTIGTGSTLTIEPGVAIRFAPGAGLDVVGGTARLQGSEVLGPVRLMPVDDAGWAGLRAVDSPDVVVSFTRIEGATHPIRTEGGTRIGLRSVDLIDCSGTGIDLDDRSELFDYGSIGFGLGLDVAVSLPLSAWPALRPGDDTHEVPVPYEVRGVGLNLPATVDAAPAPYRLVGGPADRVILTDRVRLEAGAVVEMAAGLGLEVAFGELTLAGNTDAPIVLRGADGDGWRGLLVSRGARAVIEHAEIVGGGAVGDGYPPAPGAAALTVTTTQSATPTSAQLSSVTIEPGGGFALWVEPGAEVRCQDLATSGQVAPVDCSP